METVAIIPEGPGDRRLALSFVLKEMEKVEKMEIFGSALGPIDWEPNKVAEPNSWFGEVKGRVNFTIDIEDRPLDVPREQMG